MSKVVFTGLESSGKSLRLAMQAERVFFRNKDWKKEYGFARPMAFNFPLSPHFEEAIQEAELPLIYFKTLREMVKLRDCDIFIDEIANFFDARNWADLPREAKKWVRQGAKVGIELYAASQKFGSVDKAFRELTTELYNITKVMGSARPSKNHPPVKKIWGLCFMTTQDPMAYDEKGDAMPQGFSIPKPFFIRRQTCELFDTNAEIPDIKRIDVGHIEKFCDVCEEIVGIVHR